eukprot:8860916-Pyramimonas_sp.AAC.1
MRWLGPPCWSPCHVFILVTSITARGYPLTHNMHGSLPPASETVLPSKQGRLALPLVELVAATSEATFQRLLSR